MKWCRFRGPQGPCMGRLDKGSVLQIDAGGKVVGEHDPAGLDWLPPVEQPRIFGIGRNYAEHIEELNPGWKAEDPLVFWKPDTALCAHGDAIRLPKGVDGRIDYEGEVAVVLGKGGRHLSPEHCLDRVFGLTIANDISARSLQKKDGQWVRAKGFDTFCPLGPWIRDDLDPRDLGLRTLLNGKPVQQGRTSQMIRPVGELLSFLSSFCTLRAGDVILTGTPAGVGPLSPGDEIRVEVEGIGSLSNTVERDA